MQTTTNPNRFRSISTLIYYISQIFNILCYIWILLLPTIVYRQVMKEYSRKLFLTILFYIKIIFLYIIFDSIPRFTYIKFIIIDIELVKNINFLFVHYINSKVCFLNSVNYFIIIFDC